LTVEDTITWLKGKHNISTGVSFTQFNVWLKNSNLVPRLAFGLVANDPVQNLFTVANFPGASQTNLSQAGALYAVLTGRVSSITADARLNESTGEYEYMGAVGGFVHVRRAAPGRAEHGRRSPLRRSPVARRLDDAELQRVQHRRERLPERIPAGPGQPRREHRRRARQ
jgi:hypothetical protein